MEIKTKYRKRPVRFLGIIEQDNWRLKLYSISVKSETVNPATIEAAKQQIPGWLNNAEIHAFDNYQIGTLILHEGKEGCFAIINWWVNENMLQQFVYFATYGNLSEFRLYSDKGVFTCVWEMAVLWFERNAWVEHVLARQGHKDALTNYLNEHFNKDV
jgi:hypothetical protein